MTYTQDWVHNKDIIPHWEKHLLPLKDEFEYLHMLEIGCFEGRSTVWFLENILTNPESLIDVIDTFEGDNQNKEMANFKGVEERFYENIKKYDEDKVMPYKGKSEDVLNMMYNWAGNRYDIIYIDGSHQQETVLSDAILAWKLLKTGGIFIFDDYGMQYTDKQGINYEPKIAIDAFYSVYEKHIQRLHVGWQWIAKKI